MWVQETGKGSQTFLNLGIVGNIIEGRNWIEGPGIRNISGECQTSPMANIASIEKRALKATGICKVW